MKGRLDAFATIPPRYGRATVTLVASAHEVRRSTAPTSSRGTSAPAAGISASGPERRRELLEPKRAGRTPRMRDRLLAQVADIGALYTRWVDLGRSVGLMTARTGKLLDLYGADLLAKAVA